MGRIVQEFADVPYEELEPGAVYTTTHHLDRALVAEYDRLVGAAHDGTVPPWVYCSFFPLYRAMDGRMEQGSVHTRQHAVVHRSAQIGTTLTVEVRVTEKYEKKERRHVSLEIVFADGDGPVCTSTGTFLWGFAAS